jgi:ATP-grasp domain-containing protein
MNAAGLTLLLPDKPDVERDSLANVWERHGGMVLRLARFWDPPALDPGSVRVYGSNAFCLVLKEKLGLQLCSPSDELIFAVPPHHLRRAVWRRTLTEAIELDPAYPAFCKPAVPKLFPARVYTNPTELATECRGLDGGSVIVVSEPVTFIAEARCFILEGRVLDCAIYDGEGDTEAAASAVAELLRDLPVPRAVVVDMGLIPGRGWAVVEFNAAWGAGLNGCSPELVWPCVAAASGAGPC